MLPYLDWTLNKCNVIVGGVLEPLRSTAEVSGRSLNKCVTNCPQCRTCGNPGNSKHTRHCTLHHAWHVARIPVKLAR